MFVIFCFSDMNYEIVQVTLHNALCIVMLMVKSNYLVNLLQPISGLVTVKAALSFVTETFLQNGFRHNCKCGQYLNRIHLIEGRIVKF